MGKEPSEIRKQIECTRERIGETIDAIAYKADIPSRVRKNLNGRVEKAKMVLRNAIRRKGESSFGWGSTAATYREGHDEGHKAERE